MFKIFSGFSEETYKLLRLNKEKNSRKWYLDHRDEIKQKIIEPFYMLAEDLSDLFYDIDPYIVVNPKKCLCHIYRDARRIKPGDSLYRDNMWLSFSRNDKVFINCPKYYFELKQNSFNFGFYWAYNNLTIMNEYRDFIINNPEISRKSIDKISILHENNTLYKKKYKNMSPLGLENFFCAKSILLSYEDTDLNNSYLPNVSDILRKSFMETKDLYDIIIKFKNDKNIKDPKDECVIPINKNKFEW